MLAPTEALQNAKCGACDKYLSYFPIYLSKEKLPICGRCSEILTDDNTYIRDTPYESLAKFVKFPCIYHNEGCLEHLMPTAIPAHEMDCPFRIISCPLDCMWQGTVNEVLQHFEELHPATILKGGEFEMDFLNSYESYSLLVYNDELFTFKRKFDYSENVLECSLLCYKVIDSVTQYKYEITVQNGNRDLTVKFPTKSAENFQEENITKIFVESVRNKLKDPSVIIGTIKISNVKEDTFRSTPKAPNPEINYDMLSELECPVCFDYITPPIYQCVTGHSICSHCKEKVRECPTCKGEIKNTQNFTLEKMSSFLTYPCKFYEYGCDFSSKAAKIKRHQKYCVHGPHPCPLKDYEDCPWQNSVNKIFSHVMTSHHDNILELDTITVFIDNNYFNIPDRICYIMKFADLLFKLHYLFRENTFYWAMQLIGPPDESRKYKFEIDITDNTSKEQRMFLRNFCAPLNDKDQSFNVTGHYVFVKLDQIRSFITDILTYRVRVVK